MHTIYIDTLSLSSLLGIVFSRKEQSRIYYFNKSSWADCSVDLLIKLNLLKDRPLLMDFRLADIRDDTGESQWVSIYRDVSTICAEISDKEFAQSSFLKKTGRCFEPRKLLLFFEKTVSTIVNDKVIFLHAAHWHAKQSPDAAAGPMLFFIEKDIWSKYIAAYASRIGITVVEYRSLLKSYTSEYGARFLTVLKAKLRSVGRRSGNKRQSRDTNELFFQPFSSNVPRIAAWYAGRTVTFDPKKRSDFFWLIQSDIPREQVLVYFDRQDIPATGDMADTLRRERIPFTALSAQAKDSDKVPVWRPGGISAGKRKTLLRKLFTEFFFHIAGLRAVSFFYITNMIVFIQSYSYWYDFFKTNNIKINIYPFDYSRTSICMHLALEHNQGISISYHWSNLSFSSTLWTSGANVLFSFGPAYKWIWEQSHSAIDHLVYCGYLTDYAIREVSAESSKLRDSLLQRGASFIICYFDENSSDDRMSVIPNERSAEIYRYFLERILEDETLGLICKPGYPRTLYQRISPIGSLIDRAKATGRCVFLGQRDARIGAVSDRSCPGC